MSRFTPLGAPVLLPVLLAMLLAVVLAAETLPPLPLAPGAAAMPAWTGPRAPAPAAAPPAAEAPRLVAVVLGRPLFNDTRRPVAHAPGAAAAADDAPVLPRLAGIILAPAGARAIFAAGADGKPHSVAEGGRLAAWTVLRIDAHAVRVRGPDGERVLPVAFATEASGSGAAERGAPGLSAPWRGAASAAPDSAGLPILRGRPINLHPLQHRRDPDAE